MVENIVDKMEKNTFKNLLYVFFISCFWAVFFYLFSPCIFNEPYHIQFFILFASSFLFVIFYFPILVYTEAFLQPILRDFSNTIKSMRLELYLCVMVVIKSFYIAVGLYFEMTLNQYLKFYFSITGVWVFALFCYHKYYMNNNSTTTNN